MKEVDELDVTPPPQLDVTPPPLPKNADVLDVVQFTSALYFVSEEEGVLTIDVMRIGSLKDAVECYYATEDASAKSGKAFEETSGQLRFGEGESLKSFEVQILPNKKFRATVEFKINLSMPHGCVLGAYLKTCRVKLFDENRFPSSACFEGRKHASYTFFLWEYLRWVFAQDGIGWRSLLFLCLGQMDNVYMYFVISIQVYLVDVVLNHKEKASAEDLWVPNDRSQTAMVVGILYFAPMLLVHLAEMAQVQMNIPARVRFCLSSSLFRKFMNYSSASREKFTDAKIVDAIVDKTEVLAHAYTLMLSMISNLTKVLILIVFALHKCPEAMVIVIAMPVLLSLFNLCRISKLKRTKQYAGKNFRAMADFVAETCRVLSMVKVYFQRPFMNDTFASKAEQYQEATIPHSMVELNNELFSKWLGPVFMGGFITAFAPKVIDGSFKLGDFLAMLGVIQNLAFNYGKFFESLGKIIISGFTLRSLSGLYNAETDVKAWKDINRHRRQKTKEKRAALLKEISSDGTPAADRMTIEFCNMSMKYGHGTTEVEVFKNVNLQLSQGLLYGVMGGTHAGKKTLLQLLGAQLFPTSGELFYPTHLRVLFVQETPQFINLSPWRNLSFGNENADHNRARGILEDLGMHKTLALLEEPDAYTSSGDGQWLAKMPHTELIKNGVARALIMNPEILVLHRVLDGFYETTDRKILQVLQTQVKLRGCHLPEGSAKHRRPKTCFLTLDNGDEKAGLFKMIDALLSVTAEKSIRQTWDLRPQLLVEPLK